MTLQHLKDKSQSNDSKDASKEICCWWQCMCLLWNSTNPIFWCLERLSFKDAFNFYLSQLRICIEQTFGLMTGKWRILHQSLQRSLKNAGKVFMCITRLHNFCINEGNISINNIEGSEREFFHSNVNESGIIGSSVLWNIIV